MLLMGVVFGAVGAGLIWIGIDERVGLLVSLGAGFAGTGLAAALLGLGRALWKLARRSREIGLHEYRKNRELLRPVLLGGTLAFAMLAIVAGHNYATWYEIERDCKLALNTDDRIEALVAWQRGTRAMESPLLLIPSDLFDLWGPNRCRSAAERHDFPPPTPAERPLPSARQSVQSTDETGQPGHPRFLRYYLRGQGYTDRDLENLRQSKDGSIALVAPAWAVAGRS
jgi:hypothetical protein